MDLELKHHVAVITGGASGIGLGAARGFAAEGCHVAIWDLSADVETVAKHIADEFGVKCLGLKVDVCREDAVNQAWQTTTSELGAIEHVVHALLAVADQLLVMNFGAKLAEGEPRRVMDSPEVQRVYMGMEV